MVLTPRAALLAVAAALISLLGPRLAIPADVALAVLIAADLSLAGSVRRLQVTREAVAPTRLGEPCEALLRLANPGRRPVEGSLRDAWPPTAGPPAAPLAYRVPNGETRRVPVSLRPIRRGERRTAGVTVRSIGPLGLAGRQHRHRVPGVLVVLPPFPSRRLLPAKLQRLRQVTGDVAARGAGAGTEVDSLREYVVGDEARAIDWRGTARRGGVVVRSYRPEQDRRIVLAIDTGRTAAARIGDGTRLDHVLDAALLLAVLARRAGDRVDLLAHDRSLRAAVRDAAGRADLVPRLVEALASLEPALLEADHLALVGQVLARTRQRSLVVLFTDLVPVVVADSLLPALRPLSARHAVVVAALCDPALPLLAEDRSGVDQVYRAAAAERAQGEREALAALLRRTGARVVDAPPARFASAVADAYLDLKAAGRL
ncbi:MAG: DUF58 domain-containing protein [Mycobacteriales bacterium]